MKHRTIIRLALEPLHQAIQFFSHQPTPLDAFLQKQDNISHGHAAFHPSKHHGTFFHQANRMYRFHAFCHLHIDPHIFVRLSTKFDPVHAFYCFANLLHICDYCTRHRRLYYLRFTLSMDLVIQEFTLIVTSIQKAKNSPSSLGTVSILTLVFLSIRPFLNTNAMLFIVFPLSYIFCSVGMGINTLSIGLIIEPSTFVNISIRMIENPLSIRLIHFPFSFVFATICPYLRTLPLSHSIFPLALICNTIIKLNCLQLCDFFSFEGRLDHIIIFGRFPSIYKIGCVIIQLPIFIGLRFNIIFVCFWRSLLLVMLFYLIWDIFR